MHEYVHPIASLGGGGGGGVQLNSLNAAGMQQCMVIFSLQSILDQQTDRRLLV